MTSPPIKAVLFDLDDTLWPILPVIKQAEVVLYDWLLLHAPRVAQQHTIETLRDQRLAMAKTDLRYQYDMYALRRAALTEAFLAAKEDISKVDEAMAVFSAARNRVTLFEDVMPILARLSNLVRVGSISNGAADLEIIGIARHFHVSIAAHKFGCAKPDAAIFHAACDALQVAPAETIYVGDDPILDVQGAQNAGLRAVWMNRSAIEPARILPADIRPDAVCSTLHELDTWLAQHIDVPYDK